MTQINNTTLRRLFLKHPEKVRECVISDYQISIIEIVRDTDPPGMSSAVLSDVLDVSLSSASVTLARLWAKGYLQRKEVKAPSGGIEYFYTSLFKETP